MRKSFLLFVLILLCSALALFADTVYFLPYQACFNVDLKNGNYDGSSNGIFQDENHPDGDYVNEDLVGLIGVATPTSNRTYTIDFDISGNGWFYTSQSDPSLRIPFGIDLVIRYNDHNGMWEYDTTYGDEVYHLGYNDNENNVGDATPITVNVGDNWHSFWCDVLLVIPEKVRADLQSTGAAVVGNANDYTAAFTIRMTDGNNNVHSYPININGYYEIKSEGTGNIIFNVVPNAQATSLDLSDSMKNVEIEIGSYYYSTEALRGTYPDPRYSPFKMFVSSSDNPDASGNKPFALRHVNDSEKKLPSIPFEIRLDGMIDDSSNIVWYDGTGSSKGGQYTQGGYLYTTTRENDVQAVTFYDEGDILFKIKNDADFSQLTGGYYSADVYFHVSCNW